MENELKSQTTTNILLGILVVMSIVGVVEIDGYIEHSKVSDCQWAEQVEVRLSGC